MITTTTPTPFPAPPPAADAASEGESSRNGGPGSHHHHPTHHENNCDSSNYNNYDTINDSNHHYTYQQPEQNLGFLGYCVVFCFVLKLVLGVYWWWFVRHHPVIGVSGNGENNNDSTVEQQPEEQERQEQRQREQDAAADAPPVATTSIRQRWNEFWSIRSSSSNTTPPQQGQQQQQQQPQQYAWSYYLITALLGIFAACVISHPKFGFAYFCGEMVKLLPFLGQLVTLWSILTTMGGGQGGGFGGLGDHDEQQLRQRKMEEMTRVIHNIPIEPFVSQHDLIHNNQSIPISQLKKMLQRRGIDTTSTNKNFNCGDTYKNASSFVERQDLIDALVSARKYSGDSCCICFEDFANGEPLRVLPSCYHEIHLECFDKWVYTFANNPIKLKQQPTCPLCKAEIKGEAQ